MLLACFALLTSSPSRADSGGLICSEEETLSDLKNSSRPQELFKTSRHHDPRDLKTLKTLKTSRPRRSGSSPLRRAQRGRAESRDGCARGLAPC
ncbi:hypothetical protein C8R45DRAFT_975804, partial [Mycena sanguinolenta]